MALYARSQCIVITNIEKCPSINNWYFVSISFWSYGLFLTQKMVFHRRLITQNQHHCTILRKKGTVKSVFSNWWLSACRFQSSKYSVREPQVKVLHIPNLLRLQKIAVAILRYNFIVDLFLLRHISLYVSSFSQLNNFTNALACNSKLLEDFRFQSDDNVGAVMNCLLFW